MTVTEIFLHRLKLPLITPYRLSYRVYEDFDPIVVEGREIAHRRAFEGRGGHPELTGFPGRQTAAERTKHAGTEANSHQGPGMCHGSSRGAFAQLLSRAPPSFMLPVR